LADEVIEDVVEFACRLSKHRGSNTLHRNDVKFAFEKRFKIKVPTRLHQTAATSASVSSSFGPGGVAGASAAGTTGTITVIPQPPVSTSNYKANLALVKKVQEQGTNQ